MICLLALKPECYCSSLDDRARQLLRTSRLYYTATSKESGTRTSTHKQREWAAIQHNGHTYPNENSGVAFDPRPGTADGDLSSRFLHGSAAKPLAPSRVGPREPEGPERGPGTAPGGSKSPHALITRPISHAFLSTPLPLLILPYHSLISPARQFLPSACLHTCCHPFLQSSTTPWHYIQACTQITPWWYTHQWIAKTSTPIYPQSMDRTQYVTYQPFSRIFTRRFLFKYPIFIPDGPSTWCKS